MTQLKWQLPFPILPSEADSHHSEDVLVYVDERMFVAYYDLDLKFWYAIDPNGDCCPIGEEVDCWAAIQPPADGEDLT